MTTLVLTGKVQIELSFGHGGRSLRLIVVIGWTIFGFALLTLLDTVFGSTRVHGRIISRSFLVDGWNCRDRRDRIRRMLSFADGSR